LPDEIPPELAENLACYRTAQAVADYSVYRLYPEEEYLYLKYYKAGDAVLDLACGMGRTTLMLYEMGLSVRGVDQSALFIETAKRRMPYLDLRVGSYEQIDEPDASFPHVLISANGLDLAFPIDQRVTALRECARVLQPGGTLIYSSHNLKSLHWFSPYYRGRLRWKFRNCLKAYKQWDYLLESGQHMFYATPEFVLQQTAGVGLKFVEMNWYRKTGFDRFDRLFSPYIHYVFEKPRA
jgi:ubiquinone/menaquinone biosynthesis C-methylase UbiE